MPFTNKGYEPYTEDELYDSLRKRFEDQFNIDVEVGYLVDEILQAEAAVLSEYQEEMASRLYDSAFVELASEDQLTMKAREAGIVRRPATTSTGVVVFECKDPVSQSRTVPEQTVVQTDEVNAVKFETIEDTTIEYIDGFEDGTGTGLASEYAGDTDQFSVVSDHPYQGSYELKCGENSASVINESKLLYRGTDITGHTYLEPNTVSIIKFAVQDADNYYRVLIDSTSSLISFDAVVDGVPEPIDSTTASVITDEYLTVNIEWGFTGSLSVEVLDFNDDQLAHIFADNETRFDSGYVGFASGDSVGNTYWDEFSTSSVAATIESVETGTGVNVPTGSVSVMPNTVSYIESVRNLQPVGNDSYTVVGGENQRRGVEQEQDTELRQRVFDSLSGGGQTTRGAIYTSVSNIQDVISLTIVTNSTPDDETETGGLPPYSSEVVVLGGSTEEIIEALYDTMSFVDFLRLHGGAHGLKETHEVYDNVTNEHFVGEISRPPKLTVEIEVDLVYDESKYAGQKAVKDKIIEYIGGTSTNEESVIGLGVGEDLYESEVRVAINNVPGVIGIQNLVLDIDGDGLDDTTTDDNGLNIIDVPENEVAQTDASANEITVNEIQR